MAKKTPIEMERERITKATRSIIRLKHSLAADIEINEVLSSTLSEFETSLQSGELKALQATLDEILGS